MRLNLGMTVGLIFFLCFHSALAETPSKSTAKNSKIKIESNLRPKKGTIGDPLYLNIWVTHDPKGSVLLPSKEVVKPPFEVRNIQRMGQKSKGDQTEDHLQLILSLYELGNFTLPPISMTYQSESGEEEALLTESFDVQIISIGRHPTDTDDIRPLKNPLSLASWLKWLIGIVAGLLTLLGLWFLITWWKKKMKRRSQEEAERLLPCHERAFLYLDRLKEKGYLGTGKIKEFHIELSDIVKRYLDERFSFPAMELTTYELEGAMKELKLEQIVVDRVRQFMEECDLVKFAKFLPSTEECERTFNLGWGIVDLTKQTEPDKSKSESPQVVLNKR